MKLLYVHEGKMRNQGIDLVVAQQLQAFSEAGWEVDFISRGTCHLPGIHNHCVRLNPAKLISWAPSRYYYAANQRWLSAVGARLASRRSFHAVISWTRTALRLFQAAPSSTIRILNLGNRHYLSSLNNNQPFPEFPWPAIDHRYLKREYSLTSFFWVASPQSQDTFIQQGICPERVHCIGRGVDLALFCPAPTAPQIFRVICSGRICRRKGHDLLLEAWRMAALPHAELVLAGDVDQDMADLVKNLPRSVRHLGPVPYQQLPSIYQSASAQILLSRNEGRAKALLEGAACGLATIATAATGFPIPDCPALTPDPESPASAAEALRQLYYDPCLRERLGRGARAYMETHESWDAFRSRCRQALEAALRLPR